MSWITLSSKDEFRFPRNRFDFLLDRYGAGQLIALLCDTDMNKNHEAPTIQYVSLNPTEKDFRPYCVTYEYKRETRTFEVLNNHYDFMYIPNFSAFRPIETVLREVVALTLKD